MPDYRRYFVPGGKYFFLLTWERNAPLFRVESNVRLLGEVIREMKETWPLTIDSIVLLPDHLHTIWSLPPGGAHDPVAGKASRGFRTRGSKKWAES